MLVTQKSVPYLVGQFIFTVLYLSFLIYTIVTNGPYFTGLLWRLNELINTTWYKNSIIMHHNTDLFLTRVSASYIYWHWHLDGSLEFNFTYFFENYFCLPNIIYHWFSSPSQFFILGKALSSPVETWVSFYCLLWPHSPLPSKCKSHKSQQVIFSKKSRLHLETSKNHSTLWEHVFPTFLNIYHWGERLNLV